jgi:hypothetical protein
MGKEILQFLKLSKQRRFENLDMAEGGKAPEFTGYDSSDNLDGNLLLGSIMVGIPEAHQKAAAIKSEAVGFNHDLSQRPGFVKSQDALDRFAATRRNRKLINLSKSPD